MSRLTLFGFIRIFDTAGETLLNILQALNLHCSVSEIV
jgi:hypothetical protein